MNSTTKEILFFLLIWIIIILSNLVTDTIYDKTNSMQFLTLVGVSLLGVLILYVVFRHAKMEEKFRLLEITPEKKCDGGSYLTGEDEYCKDKWSSPQGRQDLSRYNCINGNCGGTVNYDGNTAECAGQGMYSGRPLNLPSRTPESNDNWENEMCKSPILTSSDKNVL